MTPNEYQQMALRTEHFPDYMWDCYTDPALVRLMQGIMGLSGESGEALDILKKHMFQGHPLDREHLALELGDVAWYLAVSADALGYTLDDILLMNIDKLHKRYPNGFAAERSLYRLEDDI